MIEIQETSWYSDRLGREMPVKRYGTKGKPCLVIPSQDGKHNDFESFGMVEACRPFIENGRLQLFCVDTIDAETWSCTWKNARDRIVLHEDWMQYLVQEVLLQLRLPEQSFLPACLLSFQLCHGFLKISHIFNVQGLRTAVDLSHKSG